MDRLDGWPAPKTLGRFKITPKPAMFVVSLRHFSPSGAFANALHSGSEIELASRPNQLQAVPGTSDALVMWRSPSESLLLTPDPTAVDRLESGITAQLDGYMVDLTGGACVIQVEGIGIEELVSGLGGFDAMPPVGRSRQTMLADVRIALIRPQDDRLLMLVDRAYLHHLALSLRDVAAHLSAE
jgi:heterotetrameric sarcosine oxidase gamma subunit